MFCRKDSEETTTEQEIFVVNGARKALLGRPAIDAFAIVKG